MQPRTLPLVALLLLAPAARSQVTSVATNSATPLSTRVVGYTIDARIDTGKKSVDATETLTYKNLTGQPLTSFPFHLYLNAFQPDSSFTTETHFTGGIRDDEKDSSYTDEKRGSITLSHIDAQTGSDNLGDLTPTLHYLHPDDDNAHDRTVAEVTLPRPLAPGDTIAFHITFHDQLPLSIARNGYKRDFLMGGQWFPKPGVFWHGAWNCHQYHNTSEFFSDFGTYNVKLTLPLSYTVGASGVPTGEQANSDGTKTLSFTAEDVGDFAWAASPHFYATDGTFLSSMGPVRIHVLALAAHPHAGERYMKILQQSMAEFDQRYGPYPYKMLTLIDPEPGSEMEGMEYPTLITGGTSWFEPTYETEVTAEHEFGHQYWYGMVASNEFEDPWLDEGINSYTETKVMDHLYGKTSSVIGYRWLSISDSDLQRAEYTDMPDFDPLTRAAWKFRKASSYGIIVYGKTATALRTLEGLIGTDTMDEAMRLYFQRYRFTHPTSEDFLHTIEEVAIKNGRAAGTYAPPRLIPSNEPPASTASGTDGPPSMSGTIPAFSDTAKAAIPIVTGSSLRPFIDQAIYGTAILDYAVDSIDSSPVQWWLPVKDAKTTDYLTTIYLRRKGDFILPVTLEVVFDDGTHLREHWDGTDRWHRFTYVRKAKIVSAEIDPDHILALDRDLFNNSITRHTDNVPRMKLATLWIAAQQFASELAEWLV